MEKPPLGIKPRWLHRAERIADIVDALWRYSIDGKPIPAEWVFELNDILKEEWSDYTIVRSKREEIENA